VSGPRIAVVVASHGRAERLEAMLGCLAAQTVGTESFELVVVDDGSPDATPQVLARAAEHLPLTVLTNAEPAGPSVARDDGWRATTAPLVAFTDDDCEPAPDWLEALLAAHDAHPDAVLQGRTDPLEREAHLLAFPNARTQRVTRRGPYYQACNIAYPRAWLERVDGFDRTFGWGGEDADLAWRVIEAGAEVEWVPEARVEHAVVQVGPGAMLRLALKWGESMRTYARHPGMRAEGLVWGVFWRPSHMLLLQALVGCALARRHPALLLLAYPYLRHLEKRWGESPEFAPVLLAQDAFEVYAITRGAIRHRTFVI
jgi:glycosyltransferase involved in cell wall biosynthesis